MDKKKEPEMGTILTKGGVIEIEVLREFLCVSLGTDLGKKALKKVVANPASRNVILKNPRAGRDDLTAQLAVKIAEEVCIESN